MASFGELIVDLQINRGVDGKRFSLMLLYNIKNTQGRIKDFSEGGQDILGTKKNQNRKIVICARGARKIVGPPEQFLPHPIPERKSNKKCAYFFQY